MKKLKVIMVSVLMISFLLPACKYEEGPAISLRSKKARVVNKWVIEIVTQNGYDVTPSYEAFQPNLVTEFRDDGYVTYTWVQNGSTVTYDEQWDFNSDKSGLIITEGAISSTWDILRLKNDELWLKRTVSGITTTYEEIHFITSE